MKYKLWFAIAGSLLSGSVLAQSNAPDTATLALQQKALKAALQTADKKIEDRLQTWKDLQVKTHYDTTGLEQCRNDMRTLKAIRKQQEIDFIQQHPDYFSSLDALQDVMGNIPDDIVEYERLFKGLQKPVRQSKAGERLKKLIDQYMLVRVGAVAPQFSAPDTAGHIVNLSDYKGKYVLLDFWASWCGPCREENPVVVAAYNRFKDKHFDILSVSLDKPGKKQAWIDAIHHDGLPWTHVSDLKFWDSPIARLYMVWSIPQNFLIDPQGKIVAKNLRGQQLSVTLADILK